MKTLVKIAVMLTALATLVACSGQAEPTTVAAPNTRTNAATGPSAQTGANATPAPTIGSGSAERLSPEALNRPQATSVPTPAPRIAQIQPTSVASQSGSEPNPAETTNTPNSSQPAAKTPERPQFTDQVLLQDIYATMDLERFALNPEEPIPFPKYVEIRDTADYGEMYDLTVDDISGTYYRYQSYFEYNQVKDHPYLHVFPGLKYSIQEMEQVAKENPRSKILQIRPYINYEPYEIDPFNETARRFLRAYGVEQLIYNPWYEKITMEEINRDNDRMRFNFVKLTSNIPPHGRVTVDPPSFGKGSTREVLAAAVGNMLQEAKLPEAEPYALTIKTTNFGVSETVNADLSNYLRVAILASRLDYDDRGRSTYSAPRTQWEIIHPELPIIKVTTYLETYLPLVKPGLDPESFSSRGSNTHVTVLAVSFVMTLQNRWSSFDDPNRWITRFQEDMQPMTPEETLKTAEGYRVYRSEVGETEYGPKQGSLDPEEHLRFPNYWHPSDYMQHSIIGPVVMTVYQSPVLEPGNYSQVPSVTSWEAPGPIIPTDQLLDKSDRFGPINSLQLQPLLTTPNPGYPLPGHILVYPHINAPGTQVWEEFGLEGEW